MKVIKYKAKGFTEVYNPETESIQKQEIFVTASMPYSEANEEIAKREAYNGEYTIEDDGQPEPEAQPTQMDVIEAQVTYTAMMTDTLLEV